VSGVEKEAEETLDKAARGRTQTPFPIYGIVLVAIGVVAAVVIAVVLTLYLVL
jgi:hypothetical protein